MGRFKVIRKKCLKEIGFLQRQLHSALIRLSGLYAVIVVTGPGQSGKTGLCKNSILGYYDINLENPGTSEQLLTAPKPFLAQHTEELITDEAQYLPELFSYIQVIVDENAEAKFVPA